MKDRPEYAYGPFREKRKNRRVISGSRPFLTNQDEGFLKFRGEFIRTCHEVMQEYRLSGLSGRNPDDIGEEACKRMDLETWLSDYLDIVSLAKKAIDCYDSEVRDKGQQNIFSTSEEAKRRAMQESSKVETPNMSKEEQSEVINEHNRSLNDNRLLNIIT